MRGFAILAARLLAILALVVSAWSQDAAVVPPPFSAEQQLIPSAAPIEPAAVAKPSNDVYKLTTDAQKFKFTQVDLELLRQVDALDKYVEEKGWVYKDPLTEQYLDRVGRSVVPANPPEHVSWHFRAIRDPIPNAFALPNGSIYVHTGLLSRLENEAQLAAVLAHESTHVFNRHTYLGYHDMRKKAVAVHIIIAGATAAGLGGLDYRVVNALGNAIPMAVIASMFGYRRELEHEADVYAVSVIQQAGYDPMQVPRALELLRKGPEVDLNDDEHVFWADHPKLADRVRDTTALAKQHASRDATCKTDQPAYFAATRNAIRHDAHLAMTLGRPRTALAIAKRLIELDPGNAQYYVLMGDAYRSLGARAPTPTDEELSAEGKKQTRKMLRKATLLEYDNALLTLPQGKENLKSNSREAERAFKKALELDSATCEAHRGLGFLYERDGRPADAVSALQKYLAMAPEAKDARQVRLRIEALQKKLTAEQSTKPVGGGL
jgi:beta-barrel assembly-enhancing protease